MVLSGLATLIRIKTFSAGPETLRIHSPAGKEVYRAFMNSLKQIGRSTVSELFKTFLVLCCFWKSNVDAFSKMIQKHSINFNRFNKIVSFLTVLLCLSKSKSTYEDVQDTPLENNQFSNTIWITSRLCRKKTRKELFPRILFCKV